MQIWDMCYQIIRNVSTWQYLICFWLKGIIMYNDQIKKASWWKRKLIIQEQPAKALVPIRRVWYILALVYGMNTVSIKRRKKYYNET